MRPLSGYFVAVISRLSRAAALLTLAVATTLLSGCAPAPEPTPTATPAFASEEEAFAAAEEVYRAYNEAGNATGSGTDYLTASALQGELDTTRYLSENGLRLEGASVILSFTGVASDLVSATASVEASVCLDVTAVRVLDASGTDVTPSDRVNVLELDVKFVEADDHLLISESESLEEPAC